MRSTILKLILCVLLLSAVLVGCVKKNTDGTENGDTPSGVTDGDTEPKDDNDSSDPYENDREWNL